METVVVQVDLMVAEGQYDQLSTLAGLVDTLMEASSVREAGPQIKGFTILSAIRTSQRLFLDPDMAGRRQIRQMQTFDVNLRSI
jgi:hypothetical protein